MSAGHLRAALSQLRQRLAPLSHAQEVTDRQLLQRFTTNRDEDAFAVLVRRHGQLVLSVCRRILQNGTDAEDVFQATFLVLALKAASTQWQDSLSHWLYEVAYRLASEERRRSCRRRVREARARPAQAEAEMPRYELREVGAVLEEELRSLSPRYREPLLVCYWEGEPRDRAAARLGVTVRTLDRRLSRGRQLLRVRLARRGLALPTALLTVGLAQESTTAQVPAALQALTLRTVALFTVRQGFAAGAFSASVVALAREGLQTMSATRLKVISLLLVGLLGTGAGLLAYRKLTEQPSPQVANEWKEPTGPPTRAAPAPLDVNAVLAEAIESARQAPGGINISMLASIAAEQAEAGNRQAAEKSLREAFELVERLPEKRSQAYLLPILAKAERKVTGEIAARKTFQRALQIARDFQPENGRVDATQLIARVQADAGDFAGAREAAAGVTPDFYRAQVLQDIAVDEAKTGHIKEALENVETIPSWLSKVKAWAEIAVVQSRAGDRNGAESTLQKAVQAMSQVEEIYRPGALDRIAVAQAYLGKMADARKTLIEASAIAKRKNMGHQTTLLPLAIAQAESGDRAEAEKTLNEVLRADPAHVPWYDIARVHIALGDLRAASEIVERESRNDPGSGRELRWQIAKAQAEGGDASGAYARANQVSDPFTRAAMLYSVAQGMIQRDKAGDGRDIRKKLISVPMPGMPPSPGTPALLHDHQFQSLRQEFETAIGDSSRENAVAKTQEERERAYEEQRKLVHNIAERMLALAEKYAEEPLALDALAWVVEYDLHGQTAARALDRLANSHAESQRVGRVCHLAAIGWPHNSAEKFLRAVLERNKERTIQGLACLRLAEFLRLRADVLSNLHGPEGAQLSKRWEQDYGPALVKQLQEMDRKTVLAEAEALLERVAKQYADVKADDEVALGEIAERHLFEMRHLTVGNPALEIAGEDLDGKPLKLSDQRGKVVILSFWFSTCNPCREMVPNERALVERLSDKQFILLGINNDQERAKAKEAARKDRMSWRSWWDVDSSGRGPIARRWDVSSWPTVYVLDHKGIIRYKNVSGKELDEAVDILLREREADIGNRSPEQG